MTAAPDPESRYTVLPPDLRRERRAGATLTEIQITRAETYIARLEAELAPDAPRLAAMERERKRRTLDDWRSHLDALRADAGTCAAIRHAAE